MKRRAEPAVSPPGERQFGLVVGGLSLAIGAWLLYASGGISYSGILLTAVGCLLVALAVVMPRALRGPNLLWFRLGLLLGRVVNPLVLGLMYLVVFVPIGLAMRLARRDPLRLRLDRDARTYWIDRGTADNSSSMKDQF